MMMNAYDISYLDDAKSVLGECMECGVNLMGYTPDTFFRLFAKSRIGRLFGEGNPRYVSGRSGCELAIDIVHEISNEWKDVSWDYNIDKGPIYWGGYIYARYQWEKGVPFLDLYKNGITMDWVLNNFILHEAPEEKFVEVANSYLANSDLGKTQLARLRAYWGLSQKMLSEKSGVTLRMIQLYEQGQNDLKSAKAETVMSLARALGCSVEELICF